MEGKTKNVLKEGETWCAFRVGGKCKTEDEECVLYDKNNHCCTVITIKNLLASILEKMDKKVGEKD